MTRYLIIILTIVFLSNSVSYGQITDFTKGLDPVKIQEDISLLKLALEEAQPGLYRYSSRQKVNRIFSDMIVAAEDSITYLDVVRAVARIQNVIACGHSSWAHSKEYKAYRSKNIRLFPMEIFIADGRYYIKQNNSLQYDIKDFTEITHINETAVHDITSELRFYMDRDGMSNADCVLDVQQMFKMAYSNFIGNPASFDLKIKSDGGQSETVSVKPLLLSEIDAIKLSRYGADKGLGTPLRVDFLDSVSTAVYTIKWFNNEYIASKGQNFISFTDSVFQQINSHKSKNVIIDIRGNRGGWTANGKYLFSYFIREETPYIKKVEMKKYKDYSFASSITSLPEYNDTMKIELQDGGNYVWANYPSLTALPAAKHGYHGKVYILTDGLTRSAAAVFAALMKEHTNAVFIGEEPAASQSGTSGMVMTIELPYTHLHVSFSTANYYFNVEDALNSKGIMPDIEVLPTKEGMQANDDEVMRRVLRVIGGE